MAITTDIKNGVNALVRPFNIRLDSWTAIDAETQRLSRLEERGQFDEPIYPLSRSMRQFEPHFLSAAFNTFKDDLPRLNDPRINVVGYNPENSFYSTPDSEILYLMVRALQPKRIIEVGCGNSTRVSRQAIIDGALKTQLSGIDPQPRLDVAGLTDQMALQKLENLDSFGAFEQLESNDILFIDSSHQAFVGSDVALLFCKIIPALKPGVVIHVHDIFLPFEYPRRLAFDASQWGEQYILHAILDRKDYEIFWPGHYLQRLKAGITKMFPFMADGTAQSFWFRWN